MSFLPAPPIKALAAALLQPNLDDDGQISDAIGFFPREMAMSAKRGLAAWVVKT